ncbi:alpha-glucuronidase family glycosyl hydrolase [Luteimonas sp. RD2P54]|uniref:Xylan alpha-1,2-glucuronidase n=1 Tax=Luteimonas endophytica TaxID=3042023 RepID=A0ABT6J6U3_9GAMM|nr:alpha-glucuronidase family glycosyl hydrolase [Luteimonas endophytica]MDH5822535.1 alpha-glucuronidase family glycosyl hydrolase [Luteimonas endophytica]
MRRACGSRIATWAGRRPGWRRAGVLAAVLALAAAWAIPAVAEDGHALWLRYQPLAEPARGSAAPVTALVAAAATPIQAVARQELLRGLGGLLGTAPPLADAVARPGALVVGTPESVPALARLRPALEGLGREGYLIRSLEIDGHPATAIVANQDIGALYGAFHYLRLLQTGAPVDALDLRSAPKLQLRVLNHWDNLDRHVERGYAGQSIWDWHRLPGWIEPRYTDYARANASIGINGTVLNNVNANALVLTPMYLEKVAALAEVFRPWGIRVYLSARFSAPVEIGGLATADPLDPAVRRWWRAKADQIYARIPDFGGFLVKANSEGQPGPQDYGRSHADGANMLAEALAPHEGVVMWRAFVYSDEEPDDRAKQAYTEFVPHDGEFADNVLVQVKNGAIDFQPREPFHPLFGAMPQTPLMMEFQITKEYLGFATHLVYLGPMWEEVLRADTHAEGEGSTVAKVIDGSLHGQRPTGIAGVANIGSDRNWSGSHFDQANWYAYGRLAWDPHASAREIAADWVRMTFSRDPAVVEPVVDMMMASHQAVVDYMTPLGLHHLMGRGHHYGPGPWVEGGPRADWTSVYFHRASRDGIGFDRTATGSDAVSQYAPPVARQFGDLERVPEDFLLWFHHVPWDYRTRSGRPLWDELVHRYDRGVAAVREMRATWDGLEGRIDPERHAQVAAFLAIQEQEAQWWRDASIAYFQTFAQRPLPDGHAPPPQPLEHYQALEFPHAPGDGR